MQEVAYAIYPKGVIRHIMWYYNRQQHWGHNDNSLRNHDGARTRRTDRFDKPEAVNGRESIRPLVYPHAPTIVLVSCVQHARTGLRYKGFPAFTWLECKSSPRDATGSRLYFFPHYDNVHVSTCVKLLIVLQGPSPMWNLGRFKKGAARPRPVRYEWSFTSLCISKRLSNWHTSHLWKKGELWE